MDKVWLVTGASRSLGRELAKAVVAAGDCVVATARAPRALDSIVALRPDRTLAVALDVTKPDEARHAVAAAVERFGRIDVLVNNAGYANTQSIEDVDEADFRAQSTAAIRRWPRKRSFHWILATTKLPRILVDSTFASFAALARVGTGTKVAPIRIELARRAADGAMLRAHFGCRIVFGASLDRIMFDAGALDVPFVTADAGAFSRVVPGLEAQLVGRGRSPSLRDDVRFSIARNMSSGARGPAFTTSRGACG
jgi:NAD(P)-dependent dehydrogenase (short-subunit alcohol dehydrogenase family)